MTRPIDLLKQEREEDLWRMCCGFINLSLEQVMIIQKRLLVEQIGLLKGCELGRKMMRGAMPETVEEFREQVPLTTYTDYLPELEERKEEILPAKPAIWVHTTGRPTEYNVKRVPFSERFLYEFEKAAAGIGLLASCDPQGNFLAKEHLKTLPATGSRYYGSGIVLYMMQRALGIDLLPSNAEEMAFQRKIEAGFKEALSQGFDCLGGLSAVLVYVGDMCKRGAASVGARFLLSHPKALFRVLRGLAKSKLAHRPLFPKDLWSLKIIVGGGADSAVFRKKVEELWGRPPLDLYAGTEGGIYATQTWDYEGMTFIPNLNFFEFIPEMEWLKWQLDHSYQPKTVLLDEVKADDNYEIVITNFHGGIMTRYRIGDMVRITSLRNEKLGIDIPQMLFHGRADDLINIAGFGRITEKTIWKSIENTGIPYVDWTARKEIVEGRPILNLYVELKDNYIASEKTIVAAVYDELLKLDRMYRYNIYSTYGDPESVLGLKPIQVTLLPHGAFSSYMAQRQAEGVDLGYLKPPHINPSDEVLFLLGTPRGEVEVTPAIEFERTAVA